MFLIHSFFEDINVMNSFEKCIYLVTILAAISSVKIEHNEVENDLQGVRYPFRKNLCTDKNIYHWTSKQSCTTLANMMTAAACVEIDSCPVEGFDKEKLELTLGICHA